MTYSFTLKYQILTFQHYINSADYFSNENLIIGLRKLQTDCIMHIKYD